MFTHDELLEIKPNLQKFALRLTRNHADAEDLLQSTLLRSLEKKHLFQTGTNLFSWTSKMMYNLFVSGYRTKTKFESKYDPEPLIAHVSIPAPQESACELRTVNEAMRDLSHEHRTILHLICVKGMGHKDAAKALHIPVGTIRSRLSRARKNLQAMLESPPPGTPAYATRRISTGQRYAEASNDTLSELPKAA